MTGTYIRIDHSSYAARPALIGSRVLVRLYEHQIEIRDRQIHALLRNTRVNCARAACCFPTTSDSSIHHARRAAS